VAANVWEYGVPTVPAERGGTVVIDSSDAWTVIENDWDVACEPLSATWTMKFEMPAVVGDPLITPAAESVIPAGSDPDKSDQE